jgi:hypothetical protein
MRAGQSYASWRRFLAVVSPIPRSVLTSNGEKKLSYRSFRIIDLGEKLRQIFEFKGLICKIFRNKDLADKLSAPHAPMWPQRAGEKVVEGAKSSPPALKRGHIFNDSVARLKRLRKKYFPGRSVTAAA